MGAWDDEVPECCDCCGHDAEDCGMLEDGWVTDGQVVPGGGTFCRECAHLLRVSRRAERCAWCGGPMPDEEEAGRLGWAFFVDEVGDLHACCPRCLAERFGITGRLGVRHGT